MAGTIKSSTHHFDGFVGLAGNGVGSGKDGGGTVVCSALLVGVAGINTVETTFGVVSTISVGCCIAASLKGDDDALDVAPSLAGFAAPTMQEHQQHFLLGIELLKRLAFDPGNERGNQPLRMAHLDHGDNRAILLERGEGSARVKTKMLRHG
jgi:hypothetical protein